MLKPTLLELDLLKGRTKTVSIINNAAYRWEILATRLNLEGNDIKRIDRDTHLQSVNACRNVLIEWLGGKDRVRKPITWETLIEALKEANLSELAKDVQEILLSTR